MDWTKQLFKEVLRETAVAFFYKTWPYIASLGVTVMGWFEGYSLFHIGIGGSVCLAAFTHFAVYVSNWRQQNRVEHKLAFSQLKIDRATAPDGRVENLQLGVLCENKASFPIHIKVLTVFTKVIVPKGELLTLKRPFAKEDFLVEPGSFWFFNDTPIAVIEMLQGSVTAEIRVKVSYGRTKNSLDFELDLKKQAGLQFDKGGRMTANHVAYDIP